MISAMSCHVLTHYQSSVHDGGKHGVTSQEGRPNILSLTRVELESERGFGKFVFCVFEVV